MESNLPEGKILPIILLLNPTPKTTSGIKSALSLLNGGINEMCEAQFSFPSIHGEVIKAESAAFSLRRHMSSKGNKSTHKKYICRHPKYSTCQKKKMKSDRKVQGNTRHLPDRNGDCSGRRQSWREGEIFGRWCYARRGALQKREAEMRACRKELEEKNQE